MLWPRSTEDVQANTPFQRLRRSWLLLLQLLVVVALVAALGRPVLIAGASPSARVILLIDRSASMNARDDADGTRLEAAKAAARETVQRFVRRHEPAELMVVAFASTAQVVSGFESNRQLLLEAIDSIEPTDEEANLAEALALAGAFASGDEAADERPPDVVLYSDGGVGTPTETRGFTLPAGELRFVGVGPSPPRPVNNVGIVALGARRDYRDPARVLVFARIVNAGPHPIDTTATLRVDGEPVEIRKVHLPAAGKEGPGEAPVSYDLALSRGALLTVVSGYRDDLSADDAAALVLKPPAAPRVALIHPPEGPDPFLASLVEAIDSDRLVVRPPPPAEELPALADEYDLVILDRVSLPRRPDVSTLSFAASPGGVALRPGRRPGGQRILSWDRQHPLLRHVSLDALVYAGSGGYDLPEAAVALAHGPDGPVIAVMAARGARHVLVGFSLTQSNWPMDVSITVFMQNVLDYLTLSGRGATALAFAPGEPITVRALPEARRLSIRGRSIAEVEVGPGGEVTLPVLRRAGVYRVEGAAPPHDRIAVNMASDLETDIRPRGSLVVNGRAAEAGAVREAAPLELWPALAAVAIALLALEWIVYCLRMRG